MRVVALVSDLITASRILAAASRAGTEVVRIDTAGELPPPESVDLLFVDWGSRQPDWAERLVAWRHSASSVTPRILLFGPHTDLEAHAAARDAGLGPMMARSKLLAGLSSMLSTD